MTPIRASHSPPARADPRTARPSPGRARQPPRSAAPSGDRPRPSCSAGRDAPRSHQTRSRANQQTDRASLAARRTPACRSARPCATRCPTPTHSLGRLFDHLPRDQIIEHPCKPSIVARPRDRSDDHPVLGARNPRRVSLDIHPHDPQSSPRHCRRPSPSSRYRHRSRHLPHRSRSPARGRAQITTDPSSATETSSITAPTSPCDDSPSPHPPLTRTFAPTLLAIPRDAHAPPADAAGAVSLRCCCARRSSLPVPKRFDWFYKGTVEDGWSRGCAPSRRST